MNPARAGRFGEPRVYFQYLGRHAEEKALELSVKLRFLFFFMCHDL